MKITLAHSVAELPLCGIGMTPDSYHIFATPEWNWNGMAKTLVGLEWGWNETPSSRNVMGLEWARFLTSGVDLQLGSTAKLPVQPAELVWILYAITSFFSRELF